jgi:hypothetical protein
MPTPKNWLLKRNAFSAASGGYGGQWGGGESGITRVALSPNHFFASPRQPQASFVRKSRRGSALNAE